MKASSVILFVCLALNGISQLKDSANYIGVCKEQYATLYSSSGSYCIGDGLKVITAPKYFLIYGIEHCTSTIGGKKYFKVGYNGKVLLIEKDDLATVEDVYSILEAMDREKQTDYYYRIAALDSGLYELKRDELLAALDKSKKTGILVLNWNISDQSEYTEGTGVSFDVYNPSTKIIKYISFTVTGYNAVDDKVYDRSRKSFAITVKGIGPIKSKATASYSFEYVWFSDLVETAKINSIKIQYMDGTFKTIPYSANLILSKDLYNTFLEGDED